MDSKLNIVYSGYCDNWLAEIAETHVNKGLEVTDDIVGVMCGNDDLASQVVKVLSENRLAGQVAVVAQDAELAACQRIVEGTQTMTVYKPIEQEASTAATLAVMLEMGRISGQLTVNILLPRQPMMENMRFRIIRSRRWL